MKKTSVVSRTVIFLTVQCVLIASVLAAFMGFSYKMAYNNTIKNIDNIINISGKSLQSKLENAELLLKRLLYRNANYDMLKSTSETVRYYASIKLSEQLKEASFYKNYVDEVIIAESTYKTVLDFNNVSLSFDDREELFNFTLSQARLGSAKSQWSVGQIGEKQYVYKIYVWQGTAVAIFLSIDRYTDVFGDRDISGMSIFLTDGDFRVWDVIGENAEQQVIGAIIPTKSKNVVQSSIYEIVGGRLYLVGYVYLGEVFRQISLNVVAILIIIITLVLFTIVMIKQIHIQIITPISSMKKSMEQMQKEENGFLQIQETYPNSEFTLLKDTFNRLMNVILGLKINSYEKQLALCEMELKVLKLQIRPHFFLNAITTISSLSQQGRNNEIVTYIGALAKNIRYMFRSGLHTVPLLEEIQHVENYFEMQELKYPGCVFYSIEIDPEILNWPIPQMLIHTIIENEYKYAVSMDNVLTILIKAELFVIDGEDMLKIEIEDDGKGYPSDVLKAFELLEDEAGESVDGSRVGLWSLKRMLYLMYERKGLFKIKNIDPHGCKNIFLIPRKPVHEIKEGM